MNKSILLIISGGIAAYKSLEMIRLLKQAGHSVRCILTSAGAQFVTPLSVSALAGEEVYTDLWSLQDEAKMGHIRLTREADVIIIAPASADLIAKMAHGLANDLASTTLLAADDKPILLAPAMNHRMWEHPATRANIQTLQARGVEVIGPAVGEMACAEHGPGRMLEPLQIMAALDGLGDQPLTGQHAIVTAGPTYEPIDPVRFIGNHSSGKQGYAIAEALAKAGAKVTLVSGPVNLPAPVNANITLVKVQTALEMQAAVTKALPAQTAICAAAVADWCVASVSDQKIKKSGTAPALELVENPDILKSLSEGAARPKLVIGFALESENVSENAAAKLKRKGCDWILANAPAGLGADQNQITLVTAESETPWPLLSKTEIAKKLVAEIINCHSSAGWNPVASVHEPRN